MIYIFDEEHPDSSWPHVVVFEFADENNYVDGTNKYYNTEFNLNHKIMDWLNENIGDGPNLIMDECPKWLVCRVRWGEIYRYACRFRNKEDALAFLLRWQ